MECEVTNELIPHVYAKDGAIVADSRQVAEAFEKRHAHVLDSISKLLENLTDRNLGWFKLCFYVDAKGEKRPFCEMTKEGFSLLAMGFTGQRAIDFKVRYIEQFNKMEETLKAGIELGGSPLVNAKLSEFIAALVDKRWAELMRDERAVLAQGYLTAYDVWYKWVPNAIGPRPQEITVKIWKYAIKHHRHGEILLERNGLHPRRLFPDGMVNSWYLDEGRVWINKKIANKAKNHGPLFAIAK